MSGDVQPRKRKDKKKKKDELGLEEPRGTAAALGDGDVFMHSYQDHGTGGHWCAKVIFFSLLAVLVTLIGLIILENRGLSELEANSVESRYSGVLEGWLEDASSDDHHDEHTLELKHHDDDDEDDHYDVHHLDDHDDEDDHDDHDEDAHEDEDDETHDQDESLEGEDEVNDDEVEQDEDDEQDEQDDEQDEQDDEQDEHDDEQDEQDVEQAEQEDSQEQDLDDAEEDEDERYDAQEDDDEERDDDEFEQNEESANSDEEDEEDEEEHGDDEADDDEVEVEKIEHEPSEEDQEPISLELPALPEEDDDDDDAKDDDDDDASEDVDSPDDVDETDDAGDDDDDFLEADDEPVAERITAPAGKPFKEVEEDEASSEKPPDTLEEEEEYEKQQEELRRQEEQSSHMWLKLSVGAALLAATHAVVRRATAPRDEPQEERAVREETPIDRRMTLIPEESPEPVLPKKVSQVSERPVIEEFVRREAPIVKSAPVVKQESEEEEVEEPEEIDEEIEEIELPEKQIGKEEEKELYSDEEEVEEEEEEVVVPKKEIPKLRTPEPEPEPEDPDDDVPDDVEIIDEEELEEEEDISDVDDTDLLTRLEAKYGRLPEPERFGPKHKDGGDSVEDEWPGEPIEAYWRQQLDTLEQELRQDQWSSVIGRAGVPELQWSGRARFLLATALDRLAEAKRDNRLLSRAIAAYLELLKMNENLSDKKLLEIARRTLDRIQFRGNYLNAEPVYRLLIRRFPNEPAYRNNLTISFLMANRADLAEEVLKETINLWPNDRVALAHYGFVLKTKHNKLKEAVEAFKKALEGDKGPACEPRFYYHYGDALLLLGRYDEAHEVHKRGAKYGHFLSPSQRSLYNVNRLKSQPWWNVDETPYSNLAKTLERSWKDILKEGEAAKALYEKEKEGLKERGEWSQMDLFVRGQEITGRCKQAPVTCSIVRAEPAAIGCRRGQIKFSAMEAGTHVRPHVGPTNCRLRMHLGLSNTKDTYIRVDKETRQWQEGKVLLFDDSFEHEVWHNGTGKRLVLIVDVWHPALTTAERRALPAI